MILNDKQGPFIMKVEHRLARLGDLDLGQMKEVEVAGTKILLSRSVDGIHAVGAYFPHKGAPMVEGLLVDSRLRCPWHQAVFDAKTGELLEPCSLDSLPSFKVRVDGDDVYVLLPEEVPEFCTPDMAKPDPDADGREPNDFV